MLLTVTLKPGSRYGVKTDYFGLQTIYFWTFWKKQELLVIGEAQN